MTKTTEELKREMYRSLNDAKLWGCTTQGAEATLHILETRLEDYLEALRQEMAASSARIDGENERNKILLDAYRQQQDLTSQARTEADQLRNKLQAFEFANKSAGEMLQAANEKIKRQRQSIGQLKQERNNAEANETRLRVVVADLRQKLQEARKAQSATPTQDSPGIVQELGRGPFLSLCKHSFRDQFADLSGKRQKQCIFCMTVREG